MIGGKGSRIKLPIFGYKRPEINVFFYVWKKPIKLVSIQLYFKKRNIHTSVFLVKSNESTDWRK